MMRKTLLLLAATVACAFSAQARKTYTLSSPMAVVTAPAAKAESGSTTIIPTTMDQEITPFDFPAAFPGIGGNKFTCWMPTFPILFDFSFAGYVLFGGGYKPASYMNDSGNPDPEYWKKSPRESGAKQANPGVTTTTPHTAILRPSSR